MVIYQTPDAATMRLCWNRLLRAVMVLVIVAVLVSCSRGVENDTPAQQPSITNTDTSQDRAEAADAASSPTPSINSTDDSLGEEELKSLAKYLGVYAHTNAEFEESIRHRWDIQRERDIVIGQCMRAEGFKYFATPPEVMFGFYDGFEEERNSREWAERYGFGISTLMYPADLISKQVVGYPGNAPQRPADRSEDQDEFTEYMNELGTDGVDDYWLALHGSTPGSDDDFSEEKFYASCTGQAEKLIPEYESTERLRFNEIDANDLYLRVLASEEYEEVESAGAACLADRGFEFANEVEARREILSLRQELQSGLRVGNPEDLTDETKEEFIETMKTLQAAEIANAIAVFDCGVAEPQLRQVMTEQAGKLLTTS